MVHAQPIPDLSRFAPIAQEAVVLACLSLKAGAASLSALKTPLRGLVSPEELSTAVSALVARGEVQEGKTIALTAAGRTRAKRVLGADSEAQWSTVRKERLPLLVLGMDPDDEEIRQRFAKGDALQWSTIAVAFGLPKEAGASASALVSDLVWRLLRGAMPDLVGKGPYPLIAKPGVVELALLAGVAGVSAKNVTTVKVAINALTAVSVGLEKVTGAALRDRLIQIGMQQVPAADGAGHVKPRANGAGTFALNVKEVARTLTTPPFQGRVAIAQVYDAYGRLHEDAGSLASFKERLAEAARAREIELGRLDLPERMSKELRQRSETRLGTDEVHFVIVHRS